MAFAIVGFAGQIDLVPYAWNRLDAFKRDKVDSNAGVNVVELNALKTNNTNFPRLFYLAE